MTLGLSDLRDALRREYVIEAQVTNPVHHLDGIADKHNRFVVINPMSIVPLVLHELIHLLRPRWGETRVDRETLRIFSHMTDADVRAFYRAYKRKARKQREPVVALDLTD